MKQWCHVVRYGQNKSWFFSVRVAVSIVLAYLKHSTGRINGGARGFGLVANLNQ